MSAILIVEDEESIRILLNGVLSRAGHQVIEAPNGQVALEILRENTDIQLVISDVVMPYLGGIELSTKLRNLRPDVRLILMSGYGDHHVAELIHLPNFLQKPFTIEALEDMTKEMLATTNDRELTLTAAN